MGVACHPLNISRVFSSPQSPSLAATLATLTRRRRKGGQHDITIWSLAPLTCHSLTGPYAIVCGCAKKEGKGTLPFCVGCRCWIRLHGHPCTPLTGRPHPAAPPIPAEWSRYACLWDSVQWMTTLHYLNLTVPASRSLSYFLLSCMHDLIWLDRGRYSTIPVPPLLGFVFSRTHHLRSHTATAPSALLVRPHFRFCIHIRFLACLHIRSSRTSIAQVQNCSN